jgi:hypothetical protein
MKVGDGLIDQAYSISSSLSSKAPQVAFKGIPPSAQDELVKTFLKDNSKFGALANWFNKCAGEKSSIIINAIGTGLLAPIVIAKNPLSKEDKETKTYSAMRQPLSAVIAIITQLAVNNKSDKIINDLAYVNKLGSESQRKQGFYDLSFVKKVREGELKEQLIKIKDSEIPDKLLELGKISEEEQKLLSAKFKNLKSFKLWSGAALSLATLPFACCALNWIYPRFMETFFSSISNAKKLKEGENNGVK